MFKVGHIYKISVNEIDKLFLILCIKDNKFKYVQWFFRHGVFSCACCCSGDIFEQFVNTIDVTNDVIIPLEALECIASFCN